MLLFEIVDNCVYSKDFLENSNRKKKKEATVVVEDELKGDIHGRLESHQIIRKNIEREMEDRLKTFYADEEKHNPCYDLTKLGMIKNYLTNKKKVQSVSSKRRRKQVEFEPGLVEGTRHSKELSHYVNRHNIQAQRRPPLASELLPATYNG